jgi:hypothetical protein
MEGIMKPKNFPGRKNKRRVEAVQRGLPKRIAEQTKDKIMSQSQAKAIRTKKRRNK